jgi:alanine racemase
MDQFVIDLGRDSLSKAGDDVLLFGEGGPSVDDWAAASGTINYEIVTRIGPRVERVYR